MISARRRGIEAKLWGVPVLFHWSLVVPAALVVALSGKGFPVATLAVLAYVGVLLAHEFGHALMAQSRRATGIHITLYPVWGLCHYQGITRRRRRMEVAWGGVLLQLLLAIPVFALIATFGYSDFQTVSVVLGILSWWNLFVVAMNLVPVPPLDGATAWKLLPILVREWQNGRHARGGKSGRGSSW